MNKFIKFMGLLTLTLFYGASAVYMVSAFIEKDPTKSFQFMVLGLLGYICAQLMIVTHKDDQT